jgi:hypothetical protein
MPLRLPRTDEETVVLQGKLWNRVADALERLDRFTVAPPLQMTDGPDGRRLSARITTGRVTIDAKITAHAQDGSNFRWAYSYTEVVKDTPAWGGWVTKPGGRTGTAYNRVEDGNGASGLMGNGIDTANLVGTFALQPAPINSIVEMTMVTVAEDGTQEAWFSYENGIDGACP